MKSEFKMKKVENVKGCHLPQRDWKLPSYSKAFQNVQKMSLKAEEC